MAGSFLIDLDRLCQWLVYYRLISTAFVFIETRSLAGSVKLDHDRLGRWLVHT